MAPSTSPAGAASQAALPVEFVESDSTPGMYYKTSPAACSCKSYQFGSARNPRFSCKHQQGLGFFGPARCRMCREWSVFEVGNYCQGCMDVVMAEAERIKDATMAALIERQPLRPMAVEHAAAVVELVRSEAARTERIAGYRAQLAAGESIWA